MTDFCRWLCAFVRFDRSRTFTEWQEQRKEAIWQLKPRLLLQSEETLASFADALEEVCNTAHSECAQLLP
jgi:hypothetical protein